MGVMGIGSILRCPAVRGTTLVRGGCKTPSHSELFPARSQAHKHEQCMSDLSVASSQMSQDLHSLLPHTATNKLPTSRPHKRTHARTHARTCTHIPQDRRTGKLGDSAATSGHTLLLTVFRSKGKAFKCGGDRSANFKSVHLGGQRHLLGKLVFIVNCPTAVTCLHKDQALQQIADTRSTCLERLMPLKATTPLQSQTDDVTLV
eukprot:1657654-Amphidinium_carterae.1